MCEETQFTLACFKLINLKEYKKVKNFDLKFIHTLLLIQVTLTQFITEEQTVIIEYLAWVVLAKCWWLFALSLLQLRGRAGCKQTRHVPDIVKIVSFPFKIIQNQFCFF